MVTSDDLDSPEETIDVQDLFPFHYIICSYVINRHLNIFNFRKVTAIGDKTKKWKPIDLH